VEDDKIKELSLVQNLTILNIEEAALYLRIPESTLRKKVAQIYENIPFTKLGKE